MTQPAISQHISSLEAQFGRQLFERHPRGVAPTKVAEELALRIGGSIDHLESVFAETQARSVHLSGSILLSGPSDILSDLVGPRLRALTENNLALRFSPAPGEESLLALESGAADFGFGINVPADPKIGYARLGSEELILAVPKSWERRFELPDDLPRTLLSTPFVAYEMGRQFIRQWLGHNGIDIGNTNECATAPDLRCLRNLVIAGFGWSVLPTYLARREIAAGTLISVDGPSGDPKVDYFLYWLKAGMRTPRLTAARNMILEQFQAK